VLRASGNYGRFLAEPLEPGFGVTLGNALRRVLLSSLPGAAVTWVRIEGIQHEFSPIPYVKEDAMEFLLNIKQLRLCPLSVSPGSCSWKQRGKARSVQVILNPRLTFALPILNFI